MKYYLKSDIKKRITCEDIFTFPLKEQNKIILNPSPFTKDCEKLRKILEDYIWNFVEKDTYLYHFTSAEVGKQIVETNVLRQYNILKRVNEGEIKDFYKFYKVPYFLEESFDDKFYISFTTKTLNTKDNINKFRNFTGNSGARLKFKVNQRSNFFRYINYQENKSQIFILLKEKLFKKCKVHFNISGITTRIAAYFVHKDYADEYESRYYKWEKKKENIKTDGNNTFVELSFNSQKQNNENSLLTLEEVVFESEKEISDSSSLTDDDIF